MGSIYSRKIKNTISSFLIKKQKQRVIKILSKNNKLSEFKLGESEFIKLQLKYKPRSEYKYDKFSTWVRGFTRAKEINEIDIIFKENNLNILELCCGDGMTGKILNDYGHNVFQHDIYDWRDSRATKLNFFKQDLKDSLKLPHKKFDLIFSYNSFEHIPNPAQTLSDIKNHIKENGYVFLEFGPLFNSPWGLHAYRTINIPYVQFLFDTEFINNKINELGLFDLGQKLNKLQPLNKWSYKKFDCLWDESGLKLIRKEIGVDFSHLNLIQEYPYVFQNRELNINEIGTQWIRVILKK